MDTAAKYNSRKEYHEKNIKRYKTYTRDYKNQLKTEKANIIEHIKNLDNRIKTTDMTTIQNLNKFVDEVRNLFYLSEELRRSGGELKYWYDIIESDYKETKKDLSRLKLKREQEEQEEQEFTIKELVEEWYVNDKKIREIEKLKERQREIQDLTNGGE